MAQRASDHQAWSCSICLDPLKLPVPCGHCFCTDCVHTHWAEVQQKLHSCPNCRSLIPMSTLVNNIQMAALGEELQEARLTGRPAERPADNQTEHSVECPADNQTERPVDDQTERPVGSCHLAELYAGPGDVPCDVCTERKLKAVQTCLKCLVSYCKTHLESHLQVIPLKKHPLVDPSRNLQENICSEHNEFKKMFCRCDQQLICYVCLVETHKGHETVPAAAERDCRQAQLQAQRDPLLKMIKDEEADLEKLRQEAENIWRSTENAVRHNREGFTELIHVLKQKRSEIEHQIHTQKQIQLSQVVERQNKLHEDVSEMKRTVNELDSLSSARDHNHFLRHCTALSHAMDRAPSPRVQDSGHLHYYDDTNAAVSAIMKKARIALTKGMKKVPLSPAEPTTVQQSGRNHGAPSSP